MGKGVSRFETRDSVIEKSFERIDIVDEYLLADAIVANILAFHAQLEASGSYVKFITVFKEKFKTALEKCDAQT